jgi:hypothetical protein
MPEAGGLAVSVAVEGIVDEAAAVRLLGLVGAYPRSIYGKSGKPALKRDLLGFNSAARFAPWLVLVDLDGDFDCAPPLRDRWLPDPAPHMCFRVAIRQVEAWLLADAETLAQFLGVRRGRIPVEPETIADAKRAMVDLARASQRPAVRKDMVPREGAGRSTGPAYASRLIEYANGSWRPDVASTRSESLARAIACLRRLVEAHP